MIHSMTGYALETLETAGISLTLELRSINSRFLDLVFRIPEELRALEPALRDVLNARLVRGKVECRLSFRRVLRTDAVRALDERQVDALQGLQARVLHHFPGSAPLSVAEVLRWPGVLVEEDLPVDSLAEAATALAEQACTALVDSRAREGEKLATTILDRTSRMRALVGDVAPRIPQLVADYQERLTTRLREAVVTLDEERVRQEIVVFAQRIDIAEEIARLNAHLDEVERVVRKGGTAGKRLDFLMQELNREANTLGSKSVAVDTTGVSVELKILIEQMREQIQNVV